MYQSKLKNKQTDLLVAPLLHIGSMENGYRLLDDLCTIHEVQALSQRLEVARLLRQRITYQEIAAQTGASTATISRVNRCLTYGAGGYKRILDALEETQVQS